MQLPAGPELSAEQLAGLLERSHKGEPREFGVAAAAFTDLMDGTGPGVSRPDGGRAS
jgi:hypothetical protein